VWIDKQTADVDVRWPYNVDYEPSYHKLTHGYVPYLTTGFIAASLLACVVRLKLAAC